MFASLKKRIGAFVLRNELAKQQRKVIAKNIRDITKVGIVFNAEEEKVYKEVKSYVKFLKEEGVKVVKVIGFVDEKEIPFFLQPSLDFNFIGKKDVNWYFKPMGIDVDNFKTEDFDVLIDLSTKKSLVLNFLLGMTSARLKIGKYNKENEQIFDLMLEVTDGKSIKYFMDQVNHYLSIINKPHTHA